MRTRPTIVPSSATMICAPRETPRFGWRVRCRRRFLSGSLHSSPRKRHEGRARQNAMLLYLGQRIALFVATLVFATLVVFAVMQILPGDAAQTMLGPTATPEAVAALSHKLGLDPPAPIRP